MDDYMGEKCDRCHQGLAVQCMHNGEFWCAECIREAECCEVCGDVLPEGAKSLCPDCYGDQLMDQKIAEARANKGKQ